MDYEISRDHIPGIFRLLSKVGAEDVTNPGLMEKYRQSLADHNPSETLTAEEVASIPRVIGGILRTLEILGVAKEIDLATFRIAQNEPTKALLKSVASFIENNSPILKDVSLQYSPRSPIVQVVRAIEHVRSEFATPSRKCGIAQAIVVAQDSHETFALVQFDPHEWGTIKFVGGQAEKGAEVALIKNKLAECFSPDIKESVAFEFVDIVDEHTPSGTIGELTHYEVSLYAMTAGTLHGLGKRTPASFQVAWIPVSEIQRGLELYPALFFDKAFRCGLGYLLNPRFVLPVTEGVVRSSIEQFVTRRLAVAYGR